MSDLSYFLELFGLFLFIESSILVGAYFGTRMSPITYTKYSLTNFKEHIVLNNLPVITITDKYKVLIIYIWWGLINIIPFAIFITLLPNPYKSYYIIAFAIVFLLFLIVHFYLYKKILKKMSLLETYDHKTGLNNFEIYKEKFANKTIIDKFELLKFNKTASRNTPFQFNQWRYKGKIRRLNKKIYDKEKYNLKLLNIFILYIKTYSVFFTRMQREPEYAMHWYGVKINGENYSSLEPLKTVLINNFFVYVNITKNPTL